ncbi:unnamed protein product [Pleuronectes platessa]|uniref:Uncharacterized protein n=1 Tax=Pleuronectes platessa TaxID=8262 RepID=A0A9N7Z3P0_PLEPL|nr:unnamed protein product [Pleuronectes platessa]
MRIHVPCRFTMDGETPSPPLPSPAGRRHSKERHVGSAVERLRARLGCVKGRGGMGSGGGGEGIRSVTLRQGRATLGSFKLDLDSPGDMPHRISPLSQDPDPPELADTGPLRQAENGGALPKWGLACRRVCAPPPHHPFLKPRCLPQLIFSPPHATIPCQFNPAD